MKKAFLSILFSLVLGLPLLSGQTFKSKNNVVEVDAEDDIYMPVTKVTVIDEINSGSTCISIESISFESGYDHTLWRSFLDSYLGTRSKTYPSSSKGWSYMSDSNYKYVLCPTGNMNFTMEFPDWVTAFSYKIVNTVTDIWCECEGAAVSVHSNWGYKKEIKTYVYSTGLISPVPSEGTPEHAYGNVTITARNYSPSKEFMFENSVTVAKFYKPRVFPNEIFGYTFGGWYASASLSAEYNSIVTADATIICKQTLKTESYIAGTMNGWNGSDPEYLMSPGDNYQYVIHATLEADTEFKVVYQSNWYGYSQVDTSSHLVQNGSISVGSDPDYTGTCIKVNKTGLYEIYFKTTWESNRIWIQQDSEVEASEYATTFLSTITCTLESTTFTIDEWNHNDDYETTSMEYMFSQLDQGAKDILNAAIGDEGGDKIAQAVARYDRILSKYGYGVGLDHYHDFMGREPSPSSSSKGIPIIFNRSSTNNIVPILIVVSLIFGVSVGGYFLLRKKEEK